jgi:preprotein translocase subunit SecG
MSILIGFLLVVHVLVCLLMVGSVLMQLPRSEGLGAAFGGGVTENVFGAQTTNVLAKLTVWLGIAFFVVTLALAMAYTHNQPTGTALEKELLATPPPAEASDLFSGPEAEPVAPTPATVKETAEEAAGLETPAPAENSAPSEAAAPSAEEAQTP